MFREQDIQNEAKTFEAVVTSLYFPAGREVNTKVERLPKGRIAIKTEVLFKYLEDSSNLITLEFKRDKKDRQAYEIEAMTLYRRLTGRTETFRITTNEEKYMSDLIRLVDSYGFCTHLLKEMEE